MGPKLVLTQCRVHFSFALLDFVLCGATPVADSSAHLFISVGLWTVCQAVTRLPAVKTKLKKKLVKKSLLDKQKLMCALTLLTIFFFLTFCLFNLLSSLLLSFFRAVSSSSLNPCSSSPPFLLCLGKDCPVCWRYAKKPFTSSSTYSFFLRLGFLTADPPGWVLLRRPFWGSCLGHVELPELPCFPAPLLAFSWLHGVASAGFCLWTLLALAHLVMTAFQSQILNKVKTMYLRINTIVQRKKITIFERLPSFPQQILKTKSRIYIEPSGKACLEVLDFHNSKGKSLLLLHEFV